jgi:hypothetical protein
MVTPTGVDMISSISRRILREEATDVYYLGSPWTWRLWAKNKIVRRGGLHIESRFIYQPWSTGGAFYGPEVLNVEPSDPEISGAWDWKEYYTSVTIDQRSLIRADSEYAVANYVIEQCEIAKMDLRDKLAYGVWSDGTNFKNFDGMYEVIDNGTIASTYAGLSRSSYPFLNAQLDTSTTTLNIGALDSLFDLASKGARSPKLVVSSRANLTRYEHLLQGNIQLTQPQAVVDQTFAQGGFSGGWYRNQPWMVDEHINPTGTEGVIFLINDDYFELVINQNGDFVVHPFQQPTNQFVITALVYVAGNVICTNPQVQAKMTAVTA